MTRKLARTGESKAGCIIWLLVLILGGMACWKTIPIKIRTAEFFDYMEEQAKFAGRASAGALKERILKKAKELDIPVHKKDLSVERLPGRVRMKVRFTIEVEAPFFVLKPAPPFFTRTWRFDHVLDRPVFIV